MTSLRYRLLLATLLCALTAEAAPAQSRLYKNPEQHALTTKDGVQLQITYYPSNVGRDATPVVILHDLKETRRTYNGVARRLARPADGVDTHKSFAVVTVDLRGHGESVQQTLAGRTRELTASKLTPADYRAMVASDLEAVRSFLVGRNDAGELNLNRLSVIGLGLGATVGFNWTAFDWAMPPLATGKQGQDIKTLVAISPEWKAGGVSVQAALRQPGLRTKVAVLIMYGARDRTLARDVQRIYRQLENDREEAPANARNPLPDLMKAEIDTELQGGSLLRQAGADGERLIINYLQKHSVEPEFPWRRRRQL